MHATMCPASGPTSLTIHTRHATTSPGDLISITTFHAGSSGARVFRTPQLFRLRDDLESNLLRPKRRGLYWTEISRSKFLGIIGDSACATLVLTPWINRAPRVALSGVVADSHMHEMRMS
jgi:hypothetical protein